MGISKNSKNKDMAWEFLKELTYDVECQKEIFTLSQGVSVLKEVTSSQETLDLLSKDNPGDSSFQLKMLDSVMKEGTPQVMFTQYNDIIQQLDAEIYRIIINRHEDISIELKTIQDKIQAK